MASTNLQKAIHALAVADICPRSLSVSIQDDFESSFGGSELNVQWRHGLKRITLHNEDKPDGEKGADAKISVLFTIETGLRYVTNLDADPDTVEESAIGVEILADFRATYIASKELDRDCLEEFGKTNALFHIWPYWRELIQSTCARFGLPAMVLPMYQVPVSDGAEEESGE